MFSSSTFAPLESRGPGTDCPDIRSCAAKNQPPRWLSQKRRHWDARQRGAARPSGPVHVRGPGQREPSHSLAYSPRNLSLERGSVGSGSRWAPGLPPSPRLLSLLPFARLSLPKRAVTEKSEFPAWFSFPRVLTGRIARFQIHPEGQEPSEACSIFGHRCAPDTAQRSGWRSRRTWRHLVSTVVLLLEKRSASPAHYGSHHGRLAPQVHLHGGPWVGQGAHPDQQVSLLFFLSSFSL